jgi:hypothetical protein
VATILTIIEEVARDAEAGSSFVHRAKLWSVSRAGCVISGTCTWGVAGWLPYAQSQGNWVCDGQAGSSFVHRAKLW